MQDVPSSSDSPEPLVSVTPTAESGLIGFNSPILPLSDESQAEIEGLLRQSLKMGRFRRRKSSGPAPHVSSQLPVEQGSSLPRSSGAEDLIPKTEGILTDSPTTLDPMLIALDNNEEFREDGLSDVDEEIDSDVLGIDPSKPTKAKPGSGEKVAMMAARRAAGLPLWHHGDETDHGPQTKKAELAAIANANTVNTTQPKTAIREGK